VVVHFWSFGAIKIFLGFFGKRIIGSLWKIVIVSLVKMVLLVIVSLGIWVKFCDCFVSIKIALCDCLVSRSSPPHPSDRKMMILLHGQKFTSSIIKTGCSEIGV
jgi:hypothetical protein